MSDTLTLGGNLTTLAEQVSVIMTLNAESLCEYGPLGFDAGDDNLYRFVGNSPTNYIDPSGLDKIIPSANLGTGLLDLYYVDEGLDKQ